MRKYNVTVTGDTLEELASNVVALAKDMDSTGANTAPAGNGSTASASASGKPASSKGAAASKSGKPAAPAAEADPLDDDLGFEENEEKEDEAPAKTIDDMVVALRDFVKRKEGNRDKAKEILKKFKVSSVKDLQESQFENFLKAVK